MKVKSKGNEMEKDEEGKEEEIKRERRLIKRKGSERKKKITYDEFLKGKD